ncbi:hypothetical protein FA95DRAFT_753576 [Auriscalpium vulgare]|uniref:Uncharacterized protein n=1 Tax=Auriscalpium vulgare TaxID=40419 RepID=A0ACB8SC82_9AGAM|nr:hypothetical protein FA95DRAFT_753576 [Auriscalpium vulgare]
MTMSLFGRRLAFALSGMAYSAVVYGIIASSVSLQSWTSISAIRTDVSRIEVLNDRGWRTRSELIWWATPIWSLLLCTMSACGEETRSGYRSLYKLVMRGFERDVLPVHKAKSLTMTEPTTPVHLLKSGWDDALNVKKSHSTLRSTFTLNSHSDSTRSSTPTPPQSPPPPMSPEQDASFTQSTLTYLESSTARQLRLPSPPPPALHLVHPPGPAERTYPPSPDDAHPPPHHRFSALALSPPNPHYSSDMSGSPASSILSADAWPKPPPTVPSPTSAHPYARSSSPTSITSSIVAGQLDALGYPVYPGEHTVSPRMRPADLPFNVEGPSVMSVPFSPPTAARRTASVHSTKSRHVHGAKGKKNDVIYMTVVKETVVGEAA